MIIYTILNQILKGKQKRVTWAEDVYSDLDSTDESTVTTADEGPGFREPRDRAAKGRAREASYFQLRPYRRGERKI